MGGSNQKQVQQPQRDELANIALKLQKEITSLENQVKEFKQKIDQQSDSALWQQKHELQCNNCNKINKQNKQIIGRRFKCVYCKSFNLCSRCFIENGHRHKTFVEMILQDVYLGICQSDCQEHRDKEGRIMQCNQCNIKPLTGRRFNCSQCENYNFCSACFIEKKHNHPFREISKSYNEK